MSLSINHAVGIQPAVQSRPVQPANEGLKQLGRSLNAGDLSAARAAYATLENEAPEAAVAQRGNVFARLGKALSDGNIDAAKTAFGGVVKARMEPNPGRTGRPLPPVDVAVPSFPRMPVSPGSMPVATAATAAASTVVRSSTGGAAGSRLDALA